MPLWRRQNIKLFSLVWAVTLALDFLHHETRASVGVFKRPPAGNFGSAAHDGLRRKIDVDHGSGESRHESMGQHGVDDTQQDLSAAAAGDRSTRRIYSEVQMVDARPRPGGAKVPVAAIHPNEVYDSEARYDGDILWKLEDCLVTLAASTESISGLSAAAEARIIERRQLWQAAAESSSQKVDLQEIFMLACQIAEMDPARLAKVVEAENKAAASVLMEAVEDAYRVAPEFVVHSQAERKRQLRTSRQSIQDQRKALARELALICSEIQDCSPKGKAEAARKWLRQKAASSRTKDG